jgi:hypothetical protein
MGRNLIEPQGAIDLLFTGANKEGARGSMNDVRQLQEHDLVRAAEQHTTSSHDLP